MRDLSMPDQELQKTRMTEKEAELAARKAEPWVWRRGFHE